MRIAVTGGRDFVDELLVRDAFNGIGLCSGDTLVHGGCVGCDLTCARIAENEFGCDVERHDAEWGKYGRAAGPIRNREMLRSGVDMLLVFPGGRGTRDCTNAAREMGIRIVFAGLAGAESLVTESCAECRHAEYHGYPPEGTPEWYCFTVYMMCAICGRDKTFTDPLKCCPRFERGEPTIVRDDVDYGL